MEFTVGKGFETRDGVASVPADELPDHEITGAINELLAVAEERGLWVPEGAGQIAVAGVVDIAFERARLLNTVKAGASLFNDAIDEINSGRRKKEQIPVFAPGLYREQAEDWLTDERVVASSLLPETANRRLMVFPKLNRPISTKETVTSWANASERGLYRWIGRMKFLANWTDDQLSGYDPEAGDADRFAIIPTAYDADRKGTVSKQKANLEALQQDNPEIGVTPIFEGSLLARRYKGQSRISGDSWVRSIDLKPARVNYVDDNVPCACVYDVGHADVIESYVKYESATRLQVR